MGVFASEALELICELGVDRAQAARGCGAEVRRLGGDPAALRVPAGTESGRVFTIRRKGIPRLHGGGRGDLLVRAALKVPTDLSDEQRELLHQLAESFGTPVGADKGLLSKPNAPLG